MNNKQNSNSNTTAPSGCDSSTPGPGKDLFKSGVSDLTKNRGGGSGVRGFGSLPENSIERLEPVKMRKGKTIINITLNCGAGTDWEKLGEMLEKIRG